MPLLRACLRIHRRDRHAVAKAAVTLGWSVGAAVVALVAFPSAVRPYTHTPTTLTLPPLVINPATTPKVTCTAVSIGRVYQPNVTLTLFTADAAFPFGTTFSCSGGNCSPFQCLAAPPVVGTVPTPCPAYTPCPTCSASCDDAASWKTPTSGGTAAQVTCSAVGLDNACTITAAMPTSPTSQTPTSQTQTSVVLCEVTTDGKSLQVRASLIAADSDGGVHTATHLHPEDGP